MLNDTNAKVICKKEIYPNGANCPTLRIEYTCPCGKGKIINERILGFGENYAWIECEDCEKLYAVKTGCGHYWELVKK